MVVSVAWFSAGRSLEKEFAEQADLPPANVEDAIARFKTSELTIGSGTLSLPAGNDSYLVVASSERDAATVRLTLDRQPQESLVTHVWQDDSIVVRSELESIIRRPSLPPFEEMEPNGDTSETSPNANSRSFFLHVTEGPLDDPRQYATVRSRVIDESKHIRILLDEQEPHSDRIASLAQRIRNEFERTILPVCTQAFGIWRDVDGDGKLTIFLTPWLDKLRGGKTSLKGFVRGTDFDERIPAPLGNRCDAIYLNSNLSPMVNLRSLLGHEYFHVLQCSFRGNQPGRLPLEEDWLSEAQAHLAEMWLRGDDSNLRHRIDSFLASPGTAPLVVKDYYRAGLWRDDGCRGATFLFLNWCAERERSDFLRRLLRSPRTGTRGLETIMGTPFPDLRREWTISMLSEAITDSRNTTSPKAAAGLSQRSIPWEKLEINPLPESTQGLQISLAPSAVRFFKIEAANRESCLRIAADSDASLQLTLIDSAQLASYRSRYQNVRPEKIAAEQDESIDSVR